MSGERKDVLESVSLPFGEKFSGYLHESKTRTTYTIIIGDLLFTETKTKGRDSCTLNRTVLLEDKVDGSQGLVLCDDGVYPLFQTEGSFTRNKYALDHIENASHTVRLFRYPQKNGMWSTEMDEWTDEKDESRLLIITRLNVYFTKYGVPDQQSDMKTIDEYLGRVTLCPVPPPWTFGSIIRLVYRPSTERQPRQLFVTQRDAWDKAYFPLDKDLIQEIYSGSNDRDSRMQSEDHWYYLKKRNPPAQNTCLVNVTYGIHVPTYDGKPAGSYIVAYSGSRFDKYYRGSSMFERMWTVRFH